MLNRNFSKNILRLLVLCTVFGLGLVVSGTAQAAVPPPAENPLSGSVGVSGTMRGPAPSTAAVILNPRTGSRTSNIPITVSGTCPEGTFVEVTKNNVFAGAAACQADGKFTMLIDLFDGSNTLIARVSDALGQYGPDSAAVVVFFDAPALAQPGGAVGRQLFLRMDTTVVAGNPNQPISRTVIIVGGIGPYAISWDWGDEKTSLSSQANDGAVTATHVYERPGTYRVIVRVTDSTGNSAFLQFVTVVNGPSDGIGSSKGGKFDLPGILMAIWPLLVLMAFFVLSFWLGERREVFKLRRKHQLIE